MFGQESRKRVEAMGAAEEKLTPRAAYRAGAL
jgi:hypothetical protein